MPSWVALTCNPSGGIKVTEHGSGYACLGWWLHHAGSPTPNSGVLRQAGFTEQRKLWATNSGGITSRCTISPQRQVCLALEPSSFALF
ncbi:hypothetical protein Ahy_B10g106242 [Arachis hypogaea]|uniref:Uncharacterized protein n=1 Tax=Arachis hypogaea TaxID=3818 RepID=A0A444XA53_ARAHY|nr:hypothetical protein Ahy_B10g106242 [Arachis hypogaea]